jgi:hypothetical protein
VYQRNVSTEDRDITFSGEYNCSSPSAIKYRIVDNGTDNAITGHDWQVLDSSPSGGSFSGTASSVPQGGWYNTDVRCDDSGTDVYNGTVKWGVGMVVVTAGQSNMSYMFTYGSDVEPYDLLATVSGSSTGPLSGENNANGSNTFGNTLVDALSIPIFITNSAYPGSGLTYDGNNTYYWLDFDGGVYQQVINHTNKVDYEVEFILWNQGVSDASSLVSYSAYETGMASLATRLRTDLTNMSSETTLPLILSITGRYTAVYEEDPPAGDKGYYDIRTAQADAVDNDNDMYVGADAVTISLRDGIHYTDAGMTTMGERMAQAVLYILGEKTYYRGPQVTGGTEHSLTQTDVTILHGGGTDFTPTTDIVGFEVAENDVWETATGERINATTIRLTHSSMRGVRKIRYLYGRNPSPSANVNIIDSNVVYDNTALALPLEISREITVQSPDS